jgi:hypothetical protein
MKATTYTEFHRNPQTYLRAVKGFELAIFAQEPPDLVVHNHGTEQRTFHI